jgi:hypothetical protein
LCNLLILQIDYTVGNFGLSKRTCNFCTLKRASFAQKLSYITYKATLNKIKHFLKKKIFNEKYLRGTLTLVFLRKLFFSKMFCVTHYLTQFHALIPNIALFCNKNGFLAVKDAKYLSKMDNTPQKGDFWRIHNST